MDERGPLQAFGLLAVTVSLKARTGKLRLSDKLALMIAFLGCCEDQPDAKRAVREFLASVDTYPRLAGERLRAAIEALPGVDVGQDAFSLLEDLERQAVACGWAEQGGWNNVGD
ncbi:hypothetical protein GCM10007927_09210 [Sulfitobacter pacificus]|uniref:Uncharacterized protein n=2 Tax=Sulfitobacter pacificus TaxID=1499314 RepID=A0ABQ5VGB0_9RHOB|nr:hypothetical protein GCM10007927_09210 [Sulfitobacter pacificus]